PGHGRACAKGEEIEDICDVNGRRLKEVRDQVYAALREPQETCQLVQHVAGYFELKVATPTAYFLTRTTVLAALSSLESADVVEVVTADNRLRWRRR
ncbi:MAG: hypothetical protein PVF54_09845, partial [Anaerolineae bacterium]